MIEDKARFEGKFKLMEQAIPGITLFEPDKAGTIELLDEKDFFRTSRFRALKIYRAMKGRNTLKAFETKPSLLQQAKRSILKPLFKAGLIRLIAC